MPITNDDLPNKLSALETLIHVVVDTTPAMLHSMRPDGSLDYVNEQVVQYLGMPVTALEGWGWTKTLHPGDIEDIMAKWGSALKSGEPFAAEARVRRADGEYRWFLFRNHPLRAADGTIVKWYGAGLEIEDLKRAEAKVTESELKLRQLLDAVPTHIFVLYPDGRTMYTNRQGLEYLGLSLEEVQSEDVVETRFHPDDALHLRQVRQRSLAAGLSFEMEARIRGQSGDYRWFLISLSPWRDATGVIVHWYGTRIDIEERKQAEQTLRRAYEEIDTLREQLHRENRVLREEISRSSPFKQIIGESPVLRAVLARVSKVAPTDTTVLITGETGTGKELIARATHEGSPRANKPFVCVNCAAIPPSLIAAELFGYEKGAFTGAAQRHPGRFELAHGGTIFLDEVGELPLETQATLLRVLQESRFERIGGTQSVVVDVRVIAATNRDLHAEAQAGSFRQDLFYRLNVFPIRMPPLRERVEDIPALIAYFVEAFARRMGRRVPTIEEHTLRLLAAYPWPGNVRELQNVIERSMIVSEMETFSVDESWLAHEAAQPTSVRTLSRKPSDRVRAVIEEALTKSSGRVSGPDGAAAQLGLPASTLESKIRSLKIDKYRFKSQ